MKYRTKRYYCFTSVFCIFNNYLVQPFPLHLRKVTVFFIFIRLSDFLVIQRALVFSKKRKKNRLLSLIHNLILIYQSELIILLQGQISLSTRIFIENMTSCLKAFQNMLAFTKLGVQPTRGTRTRGKTAVGQKSIPLFKGENGWRDSWLSTAVKIGSMGKCTLLKGNESSRPAGSSTGSCPHTSRSKTRRVFSGEWIAPGEVPMVAEEQFPS